MILACYDVDFVLTLGTDHVTSTLRIGSNDYDIEIMNTIASGMEQTRILKKNLADSCSNRAVHYIRVLKQLNDL